MLLAECPQAKPSLRKDVSVMVGLWVLCGPMTCTLTYQREFQQHDSDPGDFFFPCVYIYLEHLGHLYNFLLVKW